MTPLPLANLLTEPVGVSHYLIVGAVLFVCGALCMATKRNALGILMGMVRKGQLYSFAPYCCALGLIVIWVSL